MSDTAQIILAVIGTGITLLGILVGLLITLFRIQRHDLAGLRQEMATLRQELRTDIAALHTRIDFLRTWEGGVMAVDPEDVTSPKARWTLRNVIYRNDDWAVAVGQWDDDPDAVCIRWNRYGPSDRGFPVCGRYPVWFRLPPELSHVVLSQANNLRQGDGE